MRAAHVEHDASDLSIACLHVARADAMIVCVRRMIARVYVRKYKHVYITHVMAFTATLPRNSLR